MSDPLLTLREYAKLAPWNIRDLAALSGGILGASGVTPINAAAQSQPSDRTIRFYVTRHLMSPPEGRGTAATYGYRHLLQLLSIKLRQMEGATLATITRDITDSPGDVLEKRVAASLGDLPAPDQLAFQGAVAPRGRVARAVGHRAAADGAGTGTPDGAWFRIPRGAAPAPGRAHRPRTAPSRGRIRPVDGDATALAAPARTVRVCRRRPTLPPQPHR
jgi:DNA-binding transcriptional MerR regulator